MATANGAGPASNLPALVSVREITEWLGLTRQSIDTLVRDGQFPAPIRIGKRRKAWTKADILAWLDRRRVVLAP